MSRVSRPRTSRRCAPSTYQPRSTEHDTPTRIQDPLDQVHDQGCPSRAGRHLPGPADGGWLPGADEQCGLRDAERCRDSQASEGARARRETQSADPDRDLRVLMTLDAVREGDSVSRGLSNGTIHSIALPPVTTPWLLRS